MEACGYHGKTIKFIVNSMKSMEGLDECKSSSVEEVPGKNSKSDDNLSSKTSMDHPKWEFCDDMERSEILRRIRSLFCLLSKNNCLASTDSFRVFASFFLHPSSLR